MHSCSQGLRDCVLSPHPKVGSDHDPVSSSVTGSGEIISLGKNWMTVAHLSTTKHRDSSDSLKRSECAGRVSSAEQGQGIPLVTTALIFIGLCLTGMYSVTYPCVSVQQE